MLRVDIKGNTGYSDISVTTKSRRNFVPEVGHADPDPAFDLVDDRNVAFIPLQLTNLGPEEIVIRDPEIVTIPSLADFPAIKDFVRVTVSRMSNDIILSQAISVPFTQPFWPAAGAVKLAVNAKTNAHLNLCLLDKSRIPNRGLAEMFWLQVEVDWYDKYGCYANVVVPCRLYRFQMRHSQELNIP